MRAPFQDDPRFTRLIALAEALHKEALVCAEAGAYRAGCFMIGSALEGMLLATAVALEGELRTDGHWPKWKGEPLDWTLGTLLRLANEAGWLPQSASKLCVKSLNPAAAELGDAARWLGRLRNLVHPGAYVRDMSPESELDEITFQTAYAVLDSAFEQAANVLDREIYRHLSS